MADPVQSALLQSLGIQTNDTQGQQSAPSALSIGDALGTVPRFGFAPAQAAAPQLVPAGTAMAAGGQSPSPGAHGGKGWMNSVAAQFGLHVTSGYRDTAHNAAVGGVPGSYHTQLDPYGQSRAYDFVGSPGAEQAALAWARQNGASEALIHNAGSGYHLHIAF